MNKKDSTFKKAFIFDPYLDTLGGGEFYTLSFIEFLLSKGWQVELAWKNSSIFKKIDERFGKKLKKRVKVNSSLFSHFKNNKSVLEKYKLTSNYELIFSVSDGSLPFLFAKKNIIHFQVPFLNVGGRSFLNKLKLKTVNTIVCNSFFTKRFIDREFGVDAKVLYPPLQDVFLQAKSFKKENIILSVGRFDEILNSKNQQVLLNVFKDMVDSGLKGWQLVLIGGLKSKNKEFKLLKKTAQDYPVKIITNASFKTLFSYYKKAAVYWHAAGFGKNLKENPQKAEHFGISILEAMACFAVPIVFAGGGVLELVKHDKNGYLWKDVKQLKKFTTRLIKSKKVRNSLAKKARIKAQDFKVNNFYQKIEKIVF
jgi:glycosyltransferase involved in cell wall biosynthesis